MRRSNEDTHETRQQFIGENNRSKEFLVFNMKKRVKNSRVSQTKKSTLEDFRVVLSVVFQEWKCSGILTKAKTLD